MAQTGYTPILIYSSTTVAQAPAVGNLTNSTLGSELAINITDGKLFYKDNANAIQVIAWKTTPTTAGGTGLTSYTAGDMLYYASGTTLTKLGIGTAYQALQVNAGGTAPSWQPSATSVLTAQGDLLYASAANTLARLAKSTTATRYLANTGTNNNPAWAQIDLSNGITGTLPVGNGGTGLTTLATGYIPYGNATSPFNSSANFNYNGSALLIGVSSLINYGGNATLAKQQAVVSNAATNTVLPVAAFITRSTGTPAAGIGSLIDLCADNAYSSVSPYASIGAVATDLGNINGDFLIYTMLNNVSAEKWRVDSGGNFIQKIANKGINFTANTPAAGMTSQLLNWYEEGTWTPSQGGGLTVVGTFSSSGTYTRIGRQVTVIANLNATTSITASAGGIACAGLPFSVSGASVGSLTTNALSQSSSASAYLDRLYSSSATTAATGLIITVTYFV